MLFIALFGNILIPVLSAIFSFILFLYFVFIEDSKSKSTRYFIVFLFSFAFFLLGRPVQILSGSHPIPLIINNIRSFVFSALTIPMVILADFSGPEKNQRPRGWILIAAGSILGAVYCIFNTLTTTGSEIIFSLGSLNAYDSVTPVKSPPYFGREITNGVYMILAILLFADSVNKIQRVRKSTGKGDINFKRVLLYNVGKLIFALTFFFGSLLHEWWIYYLGSFFSVSFLGYGVVLDIKENKYRMQQVIAFIREDLIQDISIDVHTHQQVSDMFALLNIPQNINTFIVLKEPGTGKYKRSGFQSKNDSLNRAVTGVLDQTLGVNRSILIPIGTDMLGICLANSSDGDFGRMSTIGICEHLKKKVDELNQFNFGIGRSYSGLDDLKKSYHEALNALEYANKNEGSQVVHISDIQDGEVRRQYPLNEKNVFLAAIRIGDIAMALEQLPLLSQRLFHYGSTNDKLPKVLIYELLGAMIESAISGGGDVDDLLGLSEQYFTETEIIRSRTQLTAWLKSRTEEIIEVVTRSHLNRYEKIVRSAKKYIDEHFDRAISVKDVADSVCISESYFKSIFKKSSGYSYSEYLTHVRMNEAKKLLHSTDKPVTEIAMDVGFQTPNSFSTLFKRETGLTPTQYKNQIRNKPNS